MSFLLDPPLLFILGIMLYIAGSRLKLERLAKITIGILIVSVFIVFSLLLYSDIFRCVFPLVCSGTSGSEFMFHSSITGIYKQDVPILIVAFLFALYPFYIYFGYAAALMFSKRRRFSGGLFSYEDLKKKDAPVELKYEVVRYPDISRGIGDEHQAVRHAVNSLGGMDKFVKNGDRVLIKVNICGGVPGNAATHTSLDIAGEVVDMVREAGGVPVICDADMIWTKFRPVAKAEGWPQWAEQKGVELVNLSETEIVNFDFGAHSVLGTERVSKEMITADVIISIPAMKTHLLTGVTLGMKNMYGTLPEIDKAKYHQLGIDEVIYWINHTFKPDLTIIDGCIGGEAIGPLSCDPVDFRTIVASNNVVTADSIAAQLMGFENPGKNIEHIKLAHERGLGDAAIVFDPAALPYAHSSDGNWKRPDPDIAKFYTWGVHTLLKIPTWDTFFNLISDFFLYDAATLPILKYFTPAFLRIMNDIARWSMDRQPDTPETKKRKRNNLFILSIPAFLMLLFFVLEGYLARSSLEFFLGLAVTLIFAAWFATRMKTRDLVTLLLVSSGLAYLLEHLAVSAGMWQYYGSEQLLFSTFAIAIFIIPIIGFSHFLSRVFAFVELEGKRFRNVPFLLVLAAFALFFYLEGYLALATVPVLAMYGVFALLGLYYNNGQTLEYNLSLAIMAAGLGGLMELAGIFSGLWSFTYGVLPVFIVPAWALNIGAVYGVVRVLGVNLRESMG